jgi:hypothetical protein
LLQTIRHESKLPGSALRSRDIKSHDIRAIGGELNRNGATDAARCAGNHRHLVG